MDRRSALKTLAVGALATAAGTRSHGQSESQAPTPRPPVQPGFHRFQVGGFECLALNDGIGRMEPIQPTWAPEGSPEEVKAALEKHFLPTDRLHVAFNALLVRTGKETLLLDTGSGPAAQPRLGWVGAQLAAAGVRPEEITGVVLSHAHGDHLGGLLTADGLPAFPNAALHVSRAELEFWLSPTPDFSGSRLPEQSRQNARESAIRAFEILKPSLQTHPETSRVTEGVSLELAPGHTPGHSVVRLQSDGEELLYLADLAHHPVLMFEHPEWTVAFDIQPAAAAATRKKLFEQLAAARTRVHLFHMPFPGIGRIRSEAEGRFAWVPEMWTVLG